MGRYSRKSGVGVGIAIGVALAVALDNILLGVGVGFVEALDGFFRAEGAARAGNACAQGKLPQESAT